MDIFSHGIWSGIAASAINRKIKKPLSVWHAAFWGVFPDLFAFPIPFIGLIWYWSLVGFNMADMPEPSKTEPPPADTLWVFKLATFYIHSAIVW